jgi:hypothetical protein
MIGFIIPHMPSTGVRASGLAECARCTEALHNDLLDVLAWRDSGYLCFVATRNLVLPSSDGCDHMYMYVEIRYCQWPCAGQPSSSTVSSGHPWSRGATQTANDCRE